MIRKGLLAVSLLLPLTAISGVAYAGHNYQHRSNEAWRYSPYEALALERRAPFPQAAPQVNFDHKGKAFRSCTYQGGPKSPWWVCR
jgi:hypothetical protein